MIGLVVTALLFALFAGAVELTGAPRELVLPAWIGATLAVAAHRAPRRCL